MISIQLLFFDSLKKISFDKYGIYEQLFFFDTHHFFPLQKYDIYTAWALLLFTLFLGGHFPEHIIPFLTI
jgi:hypothetical protein